jgi:hypothetical protein
VQHVGERWAGLVVGEAALDVQIEVQTVARTRSSLDQAELLC